MDAPGRVLVVGLVLALGLALAVGLATGPVAQAADPTGPPTQPTCDERFPAGGPAGLDLRLGCLLGEVVGTFTGSTDQGDPAPLSGYLEPLALVGLALAGAVIALIISRRLLGRGLAPVTPSSWWSCGACRSLNPDAGVRCYACGAARPSSRDPVLDRPPDPAPDRRLDPPAG